MLKRKIDEKIAEWKSRKYKMPLLISGARQVGKTTSIKEFAAQNYATTYELNFVEQKSLASIFDGDLDADTILRKLRFKFPTRRLVQGNTVLFLDEIQECPNAYAALKFLKNDPRFDVIASGSLLGINFKEVISVPVGNTEDLEMRSLDFEEFLWAMGIGEDIIDELRSRLEDRKPVDPILHKTMLELFRTFMVVGGMPSPVAAYAAQQDYSRVLSLQKWLNSGYLKDVVKYAAPAEKPKILLCLSSMTSQLAKEHRKFQYSVVEKGAGERKYGGSLVWLHDAGLVSFCHNISKPEMPLESFKIGKEFKVYMKDTGLLVSMYGNSAADMIMSESPGIARGGIYENVIAECLSKNGHELRYFSPSSQLEIDFMMELGGKLCAVEVKGGENTKSKALASVLDGEKYKVERAIRFSPKNIGDDGVILSLPHYMAFLVDANLKL